MSLMLLHWLPLTAHMKQVLSSGLSRIASSKLSLVDPKHASLGNVVVKPP